MQVNVMNNVCYDTDYNYHCDTDYSYHWLFVEHDLELSVLYKVNILLNILFVNASAVWRPIGFYPPVLCIHLMSTHSTLIINNSILPSFLPSFHLPRYSPAPSSFPTSFKLPALPFPPYPPSSLSLSQAGEEDIEADAPKTGKNQFNYSERAAQTFNNTLRTRGVATEPPPVVRTYVRTHVNLNSVQCRAVLYEL